MKQVERIILTRGDNIDLDGVKCDKCCAVQIEGKLYWLSRDFARLEELTEELRQLGIMIGAKRDNTGSRWIPTWGVIDAEGWATCDNVFTKAAKHHDDIFKQDSSYMKKTVRNGIGSMWWTANQISVAVNGSIR